MRRLVRFLFKHRYKLLIGFVALTIGYYFCLPRHLFQKPDSTVLFDKNGKLLGAKIASDGQWRFPHSDSIPEKFKKALVTFEDKRFYRHWGVDIWALGRAIRSNFTKGQRVSGASTLSMQVIRLSRDNPSRTIFEKAWEIILATRMEWGYSKDQILAMYASNAPFGGNVVGLDAAAWKYFGRAAGQLSWAESAMLAVLPNSPALIHLSKNREKLKIKRNKLLDRLRDHGHIDSLTCNLSKLEELPDKPKALPRHAPHLLERVHKELVTTKKIPSGIVHATLDETLQKCVNEVVDRHNQQLSNNRIFNAAALVIDVSTGDVLVYIGNAPNALSEHGSEVDVVTAARSSGSILKPFLLAAMLNDGEILPNTLFPDIPTQFGGYTPKNFDMSYNGAVQASQAIARSLNVPTVHMLRQYSVTRFHHKLKEMGMTTLSQSPDHYGLTLILGGAETSLWDLGAMYSAMARSLLHFGYYNSRYAPNNFRPLNYLKNQSKTLLLSGNPNLTTHSPIQAAAIYQTFNAMQEVGRPGAEGYWESFISSSRIAWKTGTSFGSRDAWAVGITPRYVVAVWVGNADGEGRPGLVGVQAAGPLLFDIFHVLGASRQWFELPYDEMLQTNVCRASGHLAGTHCTEVDTLWVAQGGMRSSVCPYHKRIHLSADGQYRVHSDCESPSNMRHEAYFVLPPSQEVYYIKRYPNYKALPPYRVDCQENLENARRSMALLYPTTELKIYVPKNLDENRSRTVFEAAHSNSEAIVYWHLDGDYIGSTKKQHVMELNPPVGRHLITLVDEFGETLQRAFEILSE